MKTTSPIPLPATVLRSPGTNFTLTAAATSTETANGATATGTATSATMTMPSTGISTPNLLPEIGDSDVILTNQAGFVGSVTQTIETTFGDGTNTFDWRRVESPDYRQYIANLRAVGCPEQVIRDIIMADLNQLFAPHAAAIWETTRSRILAETQARTTQSRTGEATAGPQQRKDRGPAGIAGRPPWRTADD